MILFPPDIRAKLLANGIAQAPVRGTDQEIDFFPVVKIFNPYGGGTWLLSEVETDDHDIAFALADLGMQCPEFGSVRLSELEGVRVMGRLPLERDLHWKPRHTMAEYGRIALREGYLRA
jgi:hypothetical protein